MVGMNVAARRGASSVGLWAGPNGKMFAGPTKPRNRAKTDRPPDEKHTINFAWPDHVLSLSHKAAHLFQTIVGIRGLHSVGRWKWKVVVMTCSACFLAGTTVKWRV